MPSTGKNKPKFVQLAKDIEDLVIKDEAKSHSRLTRTQTEGLRIIAHNLNNVLNLRRYPKLEDLPKLLLSQRPEVSWVEDPLQCWEVMEPIVEAMTDQVNWREPFPKSVASVLMGKPWNPNKRIPRSEVSILIFNAIAKQYPIPLKIFKGEGEKEIYPDHQPIIREVHLALWYLWRFFFRDRGWERLKRCPKCLRWFVDNTRNKKKLRCSSHCTWQWWSRDRRKETRRQFQKCPKCKRKFYVRYWVKKTLRMRESCPHCGFEIEPKKRKVEKFKCLMFHDKYFYNDELCLYEQGKVPDPSKVCVKCDYYKKSKLSKKMRRYRQ